MIADRFGVAGLPRGYFYFPIGAGGLEVHDPMIEMFCLRASLIPEPESVYAAGINMDLTYYNNVNSSGENMLYPPGLPGMEFMSFEEYTSFPARFTHLASWRWRYIAQLSHGMRDRGAHEECIDVTRASPSMVVVGQYLFSDRWPNV